MCRRNCYIVRPSQLGAQTNLLAMILIRLISATCRGWSGLDFLPRYVGCRSCHAMKIETSWEVGDVSEFLGTWKSYSQEVVDCSRPFSGFGGRSSSFRMKVYFLSSELAGRMVSWMPSVLVRFQWRSSPVVRCDAKPAPPSVSKSKVPRKAAQSSLMSR